MSAGIIVLNIAYAIYVASALFKKIFALRIVLLVATAAFIVYGVIEEIWSLVAWNVLFGGGHLIQLWRMIRERMSVDLDEEAEGIHRLLFSDLDRTLFNKLWHTGNQVHLSDGQTAIQKGSTTASLFLLLDGVVEIRTSPTDPIIHLGTLRFIGEMSNLVGEGANADVTARGQVRARAWDRSELADLRAAEPEIDKSVLAAISRDVVRKLS